MTTVPFSLSLDSSLKTQLEREAKERDRTASYIATEAIRKYLQAKENKKLAIDKATKQADKGLFVSQKTMRMWVDSWGTDSERPQPESDIFPNDSV